MTESKQLERTLSEENISSSESNRSRKQWERSPDQMKEISRSLSQINGISGTQVDKRDQNLIRNKRSTNEKLKESQTIKQTLPPINSSDSDSGREPTDKCICEAMYKSGGELRLTDTTNESNQWVVTRPIRNRPKDNLRLEGPMEMETTFKTTYESTAKQINESLGKNVAVVMPSNKVSTNESNSERLKRSKINELSAIKSSKKKPKHRPSTSLKAGGDGYFNTINKESYKNFVIIDDKSKPEKAINSSNGKKSSICCTTVSNIKLPKVDSNNREDQQISRRLSKEEKSTQIEQIDRSMQRLTTSDRHESRNISEKTQTNGQFGSFVDTSVQTTNDFSQTNGYSPEVPLKSREQKSNEKTSLIAQQKEGTETRMANENQTTTSWTIDSTQEHKRFFTRDVDNIKEQHLLDLDEPQQQNVREIQRIVEKDKQMRASNELTEKSRNSRIRYESKNYVQPQTRQKKHKNESSMKLFDGTMDFTTTTRTCFSDKSPSRGENSQTQTQYAETLTKPVERERTAGKRSRKSGRKGNLFRTSTEAEFYEPYGQKTSTTQTTYQKQFGDRLYCPAIDLGSNKSEFKYRGEASGHKFFLPAVNN